MFNVLKNKLGEILNPIIPRYERLTKYSTTEIKTGKKWKDGRDIYTKTITISNLPNNTYIDYATGLNNVRITELNFSFVRESDGIVLVSNQVNIKLVQAHNWGSIIRIMTDYDLSEYSGDITLEYIKL